MLSVYLSVMTVSFYDIIKFSWTRLKVQEKMYCGCNKYCFSEIVISSGRWCVSLGTYHSVDMVDVVIMMGVLIMGYGYVSKVKCTVGL